LVVGEAETIRHPATFDRVDPVVLVVPVSPVTALSVRRRVVPVQRIRGIPAVRTSARVVPVEHLVVVVVVLAVPDRTVMLTTLRCRRVIPVPVKHPRSPDQA